MEPGSADGEVSAPSQLADSPQAAADEPLTGETLGAAGAAETSAAAAGAALDDAAAVEHTDSADNDADTPRSADPAELQQALALDLAKSDSCATREFELPILEPEQQQQPAEAAAWADSRQELAAAADVAEASPTDNLDPADAVELPVSVQHVAEEPPAETDSGDPPLLPGEQRQQPGAKFPDDAEEPATATDAILMPTAPHQAPSAAEDTLDAQDALPAKRRTRNAAPEDSSCSRPLDEPATTNMATAPPSRDAALPANASGAGTQLTAAPFDADAVGSADSAADSAFDGPTKQQGAVGDEAFAEAAAAASMEQEAELKGGADLAHDIAATVTEQPPPAADLL